MDMKTSPIICSGYELDSVLADIRERKGFADRLEAGFDGHNAMYRVSYFERVSEMTDRTQEAEKQPCRIEGDKPSALTNLTEKRVRFSPGPQNPRKVTAHEPSQTVAGPVVAMEHAVSSISIEERFAALQSKLAAAGKIKRRKPIEARLPHPND